MKLLLISLATITLAGCVQRPGIVKLNCFVRRGDVNPAIQKEAQAPVLMHDGCVFFYGTDSVLHQVCDKACGVN